MSTRVHGKIHELGRLFITACIGKARKVLLLCMDCGYEIMCMHDKKRHSDSRRGLQISVSWANEPMRREKGDDSLLPCLHLCTIALWLVRASNLDEIIIGFGKFGGKSN
jgi:hypothetical protein